mgnify:CR=1 FL=1
MAAGHFLVDPFEIDTSLEAKICVLFDERTAVCVPSTNGTVVEPLRTWVSPNWETEW